jgi:ABC-type amino acid transport substrate-binding protein
MLRRKSRGSRILGSESEVTTTVVCLGVALVMLGAASASAASPTLDRIRDTGKITFAYRASAAPFSYKDREGHVRGYSVELCTRVASAIQQALKLKDLKVEWLPVEAKNRLDAVISGRADAECGTTTISLSRMESVDFSLPIYVDGGSVLVRTGSKIVAMGDLKDRKIGVIPGTTTEQALTRQLSLLDAPATLVPVNDAEEGLSALVNGKVDGFAGDRIVLDGLRLRAVDGGQLWVLATDFSYEPYGIVLRRDDPDFRLAVNRALVGIYRKGEIDRIYQQWLAPLGRPGPLLNYLSTLPE